METFPEFRADVLTAPILMPFPITVIEPPLPEPEFAEELIAPSDTEPVATASTLPPDVAAPVVLVFIFTFPHVMLAGVPVVVPKVYGCEVGDGVPPAWVAGAKLYPAIRLKPPPLAEELERLMAPLVVLVFIMLPEARIVRLLPLKVRLLPKFFKSMLPFEFAIVPAPIDIRVNGLPVTVPWLINVDVTMVNAL